ncbi:MAG: sulfite exporter TauE/SafE family protein [Rhodocyclaceae bacterium]
MLSAALGYLAVGGVSGFFAGLLGIGGGIILVPALVWLLAANGYPAEYVFQAALGTSMATILFTAASSLRAHHAHGAVIWPILRVFAPGVLVGAMLGSVLARYVPVVGLTIFFCTFLLFVALQMGLDFKPRPGRDLPAWPGQFGVATGIGVVSALVAVGGGAMTVPFLVWCNVPIRRAIGTSAAVGLPIAVGGSLGYVVNGLSIPSLPSGSLGFVFLPALLWTVLASALTAPLGAWAVARLPAQVLKRIFAVLLIGVAIYMAMRLEHSI